MLVSDRGMITDACINVCTPAPASQLGLDIGVRHHAIRKLAEDGVFLRSLFDERGLVEIASDACLANAWWCAATRYSRSAGDASARNCSRPPRPTPSTSPRAYGNDYIWEARIASAPKRPVFPQSALLRSRLEVSCRIVPPTI